MKAEELLGKIKKNENSEYGVLKIFLGYSAGVGKTYHMLDLAIDIAKSGKDVVVGYIERHQRKGTLELLDKLEIIEPKKIQYGNILVNEVDVEAIIKRNPDIVIVDECAHTNANNLKNKKRYQDIEDILKSGINVYTTLNIQHIESLNDIIKKLTTVKVKEIVPDKFIKKAQNIEIIDLEPAELIERIEQGKVYQKDKIQDAFLNFFKLENLIKLRELTFSYMVQFIKDNDINSIQKDRAVLILYDKYDEEEYDLKIKKMYDVLKYQNYSLDIIFISNEDEIYYENVKRENINIYMLNYYNAKQGIKDYILNNNPKKIILHKSSIIKTYFRIINILKISSADIHLIN